MTHHTIIKIVVTWAGLLFVSPAIAQTALTEADLERYGPGILSAYTAEEAAEKGGTSSDMEIYDGRIYFAYGGTNNLVWHKFIYFDVNTKTFDVGKKPDGEPFTVAEESIRTVRVFPDGVYFACYDPHSGSQTKQVRLTSSGEWQRLNVTRTDSHSSDFYSFDSLLFTNVGNYELAWPRIFVSADDGATWQGIDQSDQADGPAPPGYRRFFEWDDTLYATGFDKERTGNGFEQEEANEPWMIAYDKGSAEITFREVFDSMGDFLPARAGDRLTPSVDHATPVGERLLFTAGVEYMYAAESIEPPMLTRLPLPPDTFVRSITSDNSGAAWRLLDGPDHYDVEMSYDGLTWHPIITVPNDLAIPDNRDRPMRFRDLVVDDATGDIYLTGSKMYLYRADASLFTLPPDPRDPGEPDPDAGGDAAEEEDAGGDAANEEDAGGDAMQEEDAGVAIPDAGNSANDPPMASGGGRFVDSQDGCACQAAPGRRLGAWSLMLPGLLLLRARRRGAKSARGAR